LTLADVKANDKKTSPLHVALNFLSSKRDSPVGFLASQLPHVKPAASLQFCAITTLIDKLAAGVAMVGSEIVSASEADDSAAGSILAFMVKFHAAATSELKALKAQRDKAAKQQKAEAEKQAKAGIRNCNKQGPAELILPYLPCVDYSHKLPFVLQVSRVLSLWLTSSN